MKKNILVYAFAAFSLYACGTENTTVSNVENLKTPQMENFSKAMKSLGNPENRATEEERRQPGNELSDRRKQILLPSAKDLIKSEGFTDAQIQDKTKGDVSAILVWAIEIHQKKNADVLKIAKQSN